MKHSKKIMHMVESFCGVVATKEELIALPDYSIVLCEIEEYEGTHLLVKDSTAWSDIYGDDPDRPMWFDFHLWDTGEVDGCDDYTPELPALLIWRAL